MSEVVSHPFILDRRNFTHKMVLKRYGQEKRFRFYGIAAVSVSFLFLLILLTTIIMNGHSAFWRTEIILPVYVDPEIIDPEGSKNADILASANYDKIIKNSLKALFPEVTARSDSFRLYSLVSKGAAYELKERIIQNPEIIGSNIKIPVPASSDLDMLEKGKISESGSSDTRRISDMQLAWIEKLEAENMIQKSFNWNFLTSGDSRNPELAGILGALVGSFFTIIICILFSFPIAVCAAIYLEEFAPKNKWTDMLEVMVNNLAAIPSIVFGLLGLAIFLNVFHLPRSSSLVGGMTLALLVLPIIIIATRNSLKTVPPSIKNAAIGIGASPMQVLLHHTIPLSMPGIMTGTIIGMARAIGETAPLLMIGMVAFVVDIPKSLVEPATALTVQIYLWADSPELAYVEKTSAAIIILLLFLGLINITAVYLRKKFEYKW